MTGAVGWGGALSYIDPTGGLPPSMWGTLIAAILAAAGTACSVMRLWAHVAFSAWHRTTAALLLLLLAGLSMSGRDGSPGDFSGRDAVQSAPPFAERQAAGPASVPSPTGPRVVILAFDGLDPNLLREYVSEGRLPQFARVMDEGIHHPLATVQPPQSPVAWSSFVTGSAPEEHGVFDFIRRDPATYRLDLSLADRKRLALPWRGTPFWELPACRALGVTALRLPMIFPPPKGKARLLAGMGVWDVRGTEGTYAYFSTKPLDATERRGLIFPFDRNGERLTGEIPGPYRVGEADVRLPFELRLDGDEGVLRIQNQEFALPVGRWSDWVTMEFRLGALGLTRVPAVTRMLLTRDGDDVSLYVSPLQLDPRSPLQPISTPRGYSAELADRIGLYATRGMPFDTQAVSDGVLSDDAFLEQAREITAETERMLHFELGRFRSGVLFAYFEASDVVQHLFWRCIDREHPLYAHPDSRKHRDAIPDVYAECDRILGDVRARLGDGAAVVVISDHGFGPYRRSVHLNGVLRDLGYLALNEGRATSGELFADVDWRRTRAYAAGFNALYLNRRGRERNGIVDGDAEALLRELTDRLTAWTDPQTGERPIVSATAVKSSARGANASAPDLVIGYALGYRASWQTALGAVPEKSVEANAGKWSGDHCIDCRLVPGIFLSTDRRLDAASLEEVGRAIEAHLRP